MPFYKDPELTLRSPEPTSALRARGFNKPVTTKFFNILQQVYNEHNMDSTRIFNCDESSMKTVQKVSEILAKRGQHQVGSLTSAERGKNVTVVFAMSAAGQFVPPFFYIWSQKNEFCTYGFRPCGLCGNLSAKRMDEWRDF